MKSTRITAVNLLTAMSVLLPIVANICSGPKPYHIGTTRIWIIWDGLDLLIKVPDGSSSREVFAIRYAMPMMLLCVPLPIRWIVVRWRERPREVASLSRSILVGFGVIWLPLALVLYGEREAWERLINAISLFVFLAMGAVIVWPIFLLNTYWTKRPLQNRLDQNQCGQCGYSLIGNLSGVCPECGEVVVVNPFEDGPKGIQ